jgi:hypothetical protein
MFVKKIKKSFETGTTYVVDFCKDCGSQDIKVEYSCNKCHSHNIGHPTYPIAQDDDPRMLKKETVEKDVYVYKCDICGKEFEFVGENHPNTIHYDCDGFDIGYYEDAEKNYTLPNMDICKDCIQNVVNKLNYQVNKILDKDFVNEQLQLYKHEVKKDIIILDIVGWDVSYLPTFDEDDSIYVISYYTDHKERYDFLYSQNKWQFIRKSKKDIVITEKHLSNYDSEELGDSFFDNKTNLIFNDIPNILKDSNIYFRFKCKPTKYNSNKKITINIQDFKVLTTAAPTQFLFTDDKGINYYFRLRWGSYRLCKNYDTSQEDTVCAGQYGDNYEGYISKEDFKKLMRKNGYILKNL